MRYCKFYFLLSTILVCGGAFADTKLFQVRGECSEGFTLATSDQVRKAIKDDEFCSLIERWSISRLADGASVDGPGYSCGVRSNDPRSFFGHSICRLDRGSEFLSFRHILDAHERESKGFQYGTEGSDNLESRDRRSINPSIVHFITYDKSSNNMLFRGNLPVSHSTKEFQYKDLVEALNNAAHVAGRVLPDEYRLVDISLINNLTPQEADDLSVEKAFWSANQKLGWLINHPIYGAVSSPNDYPEIIRKKLAKHHSIGRIRDLISDIHNLLIGEQGKPLLLYVHCEAGKDRTGEVSAAYAMRYLGVSYADAIEQANQIAGRNIVTFDKNGLQWYAYYLTYYEHVKTIGPID